MLVDIIIIISFLPWITLKRKKRKTAIVYLCIHYWDEVFILPNLYYSSEALK